jgi:cell division protein ZapE
MVKLYHCPMGEEADKAMTEAFNQLVSSQDEDPVLHIEAREIVP